MRKPVCKMTLKDLMDYLNSQAEGPENSEPSCPRAVEEWVFIRGAGAHTMVLNIEAMKQIVHSCMREAVCAN